MDWAGESSIGNLDVNIQISDKIISTIEMIFISSFETHAFREGPEGPQPNVKSLCQVRARCNPLGEFVCIDTSHSTLGIAVEAPDIIKFMVPQVMFLSSVVFLRSQLLSLTRKPEFTIKYVSTETNTNTVGLTAGVNFTSTGPVPSISVNHQRAWGSMRTVERLGTQPALPYLLRTNIGARAPIKGISYRGYDFSYQQQFPDDPWVDWLNIPLTVGAIMSKEARHGPTTPKISAINRHQFLVWAKSPNPQAPAQGVLLFVNQVIPDVKALHPEWTGVVNVNLADGAGSAPCTNSSVDTTEPSQHAVALGLLLQPSKRTTWLHHAKAKVTQLIQRFRSKSLKTLDIDVTRSVTGWEGMNRAWLTLLYPRLDEKLQPFFGEEATYNLKM
ncbi:hypothetical protein C8F01DRAFT_1153501 [Mycena amicta]|nr:hypothetical protein C8F01DRAFT_1153501 [Mycena amicta]